MAEGLGKIRPTYSCGNGPSEKWANYCFHFPSPFYKSMCRKEDSKQNQLFHLGQHITVPSFTKKNEVPGGQKQCTETNVSEVNSSESIVYIEYS